MSHAARILVVGVGNPLARDEGVGPLAVERLEKLSLPDGVACIDAGTDLLAILPELARARRAVLVDAVRAGASPGTIHRLTLDELQARARPDPAPSLSAHDASVLQAVQLARAAGTPLPPIVLIGVEPAEVAVGEGLSAPVRDAMDALIEAVVNEIGEPGV